MDVQPTVSSPPGRRIQAWSNRRSWQVEEYSRAQNQSQVINPASLLFLISVSGRPEFQGIREVKSAVCGDLRSAVRRRSCASLILPSPVDRTGYSIPDVQHSVKNLPSPDRDRHDRAIGMDCVASWSTN